MPTRIMLSVETVHPIVEGIVQPRVPERASGSTLDVYDGHGGFVPGHPSGFPKAVTEIQVLHVHPVPLVEEADGIKRGASHEHERPVDGIHRTSVDTGCAVLGKCMRHPRSTPYAEKVPESAGNRWEGAFRRMIKGPILEDQAT